VEFSLLQSHSPAVLAGAERSVEAPRLIGSSVDITIPVLNEEQAIVSSLTTLSSYLARQCSHDWSITVADNGSTDRTFDLASSFAATNPRISVLRLEERGRGRALKEAWSTSTADVVAYMDVDLSTGLDSLGPLIDPIFEGRCDVSIGSRLLPGSDIARSVKRELISRCYNVIVQSILHCGVADAQCGFKAMRTSFARELIPEIEDNGWFFDTELLARAYRAGLRINEIPVRWVEDNDSRVRIVQTATDDLKGVWRLWLDGKRGGSTNIGNRHIDTHAPGASPAAKEERRSVDFDTYAASYEDAVDRSVSFTGRDSAFFARRKVEILEDIVRPTLGSLQGVSLLDVGCGTGTMDQFLAPRVQHLHGVDISEEMLSKAERNVPTAEFTWYDGEKLPFADQTFDVVVAMCVLHHVPLSMRFKVVSEMVRVTRPQGVVAVFEHNPYNPLTRRAVDTCELDRDAILLSPRETVQLLTEPSDAEPQVRHYLFSPLGGAIGCSLDRHLRRVPFGGQYVGWVTPSCSV
jgi:ubiquinone/menaquinone biosynthesis C-methylase UbiE/glycosyltransferase involved in cell wall biosynthesis